MRGGVLAGKVGTAQEDTRESGGASNGVYLRRCAVVRVGIAPHHPSPCSGTRPRSSAVVRED